MTEGEKAILAEFRALRGNIEQGFDRVHKRIDDTNKEIGATNKEVGKVKEVALVNKTKVGTFVAGMTFVFTGIASIISYYFKTK